MQILLTLVIFIAGLCIVICLHELGHLLTAKSFNVYCEEFSIGFGPKIIHINPKNKETGKPLWETSLNVRCIPLGGYVAMVGDNDEDDLNQDDPDAPKIPKERTFRGVAHWKQAIIMIAGIMMNVILSYILFFSANFFCKQQDLYTNKINVATKYTATYGEYTTEAQETIFSKLGVKSGDRIVGFDIKITDGKGSNLKFVDNSGYTLTSEEAKVLLDNGYFSFNATLDSDNITANKLLYSITSVCHYVDDKGNTIYFDKNGNEIDLTHKNYADKLVYYRPANENADITISIKYLSKEDNYNLDNAIEKTDHFNAQVITTAQSNSENDYYYFPSMGVKVYTSYASFNTPSGKHIEGTDNISWESFKNSLAKSFIDQGTGISSVFSALGSLFTPSGWKNVGGIISIFTTTEQAISLGAYYVLWVWGMISINLAVMNFIPVPGLDGWQLMLCIIESITRKEISKKFKTIASIVGFSVLGIFAIALIVLDIIRLII